MLAAVLHGIRDLRVEQRPAGTGSRARFCCGFAARAFAGPTCIISRKGGVGSFAVTAPFILGHEVTGEVVAVGEGVSSRPSGSAWSSIRRGNAAIATTAAPEGAISAAAC